MRCITNVTDTREVVGNSRKLDKSVDGALSFLVVVVVVVGGIITIIIIIIIILLFVCLFFCINVFFYSVCL
jgi:hypothetical protein